jgi:hypothetical protein
MVTGNRKDVNKDTYTLQHRNCKQQSDLRAAAAAAAAGFYSSLWYETKCLAED